MENKTNNCQNACGEVNRNTQLFLLVFRESAARGKGYVQTLLRPILIDAFPFRISLTCTRAQISYW
jgi:hypothetical protein